MPAREPLQQAKKLLNLAKDSEDTRYFSPNLSKLAPADIS